MTKQEILEILEKYNITSFYTYKELETTNGTDYRLNIFIDNAYVLRINGSSITETRLESISRLCERYRKIGVLTPRIYPSKEGTYLTKYNSYVCYLSEYLDYKTEEELDNACDHNLIQKEVWRSIGRLSQAYSNVDLSDVYSMWSIIDLAPLDIEIDEKQENLNTFVSALKTSGETELANQLSLFNEKNREAIKKVYKQLPRCVIQGDLNWTNILVEDNHFKGLIDFNMSGTEVNINHFCAETNVEISIEEFKKYSALELYKMVIEEQDKNLAVIFEEYLMSDLEKEILENYRNIVLISQYPNVMEYLEFLKVDRSKLIEFIRYIIQR
ncbi:MAG: phosphotransferase [Anaeroplasmataceae bacterium]|nr:phosphotransferase [Anaeroplasmataceae bacterium]MDE6413976.1 phosphotransferase [Anaeroplasmataceae bacterium]